MSPDLLARSYDALAPLWQEPHLQTNGIAQMERALAFAKNRGHALDIGCAGIWSMTCGRRSTCSSSPKKSPEGRAGKGGGSVQMHRMLAGRFQPPIL